MGFLNNLFGKKDQSSSEKQAAGKTSAAVLNSEELKKQVFESIEKNHFVEFETLCQENENLVLREFAQWKKAPPEVQTDKELMRKYAYCLMVIASYFQKQRNRSELMTMLTGIDDSEHSRKWQELLGQCKGMMQQELRFQESIPLLESCLDLASGVSGAGVDKFLPLTLGFLGECYFQLGQMDKGAEYVEKALQCTTMQGDYDASYAYRSNLFEIYRYEGNLAKAAECAQTIADNAYERGDLVTASNWRHHLRSVSAGENKPHRIALKIGDELFELDEIPKVEGEKVEFIFARNRMELVLCSQKCWEGRELTTQAKYEEAIKAFEEASKFDPYSPQPYYMSGNIKLAGRAYGDAIADLEKVEELCPGFETSRSDLWLARQLEAKTIEHEACKVVYEVNYDHVPLEEKLSICLDALQKYPKFGEAYWRAGKFMIDSNRREEAIDIFRTGVERAEDPDSRTRMLRDLSILSQDDAEKRKYLKEAAEVEGGNLLAQAMAVYMLRQMEDE